MTEKDLRKMVAELLADSSDTLSAWECEFLDSMKKWSGDYTEKQAAIIDRIWAKVFG